MERAEKFKKDILEGPIVKTLFKLGWPVMAANAFQIFYNLADTYWLGKMGKEAVAAPTVAFPIIFLLISIGIGFSIAGVSLVSQHTGAGSEGKSNMAAGQVISFMLASSILIASLGFFASYPLLKNLMGISAAVLPKALPFVRIIFAGLPFMFVYFAFRSLVRGVGDMITPMLLTGGSVILNVILDPLLIFGWGGLPELGVPGAAVATVISRVVAAFVALYLLFSGRLGIELKLSHFRLKFRWIKQVVSIGLPSSIGMSVTAVGAIFLMGLISRISVTAVSAYGIGQRVIRIMIMIALGLTAPLTTMVGQNIGAEQVKRAEEIVKKSMVVLFVALSGIGLLILLARTSIFRVFIDEAAVVDKGIRFLAIYVLSIPFFGIFAAVRAIFRGSGHTRPPMVLSIIRIFLIRVGLSYVLAFGLPFLKLDLGADGIWFGLTISNILAALMAIGLLYWGNWKEQTIEREG